MTFDAQKPAGYWLLTGPRNLRELVDVLCALPREGAVLCLVTDPNALTTVDREFLVRHAVPVAIETLKATPQHVDGTMLSLDGTLPNETVCKPIPIREGVAWARSCGMFVPASDAVLDEMLRICVDDLDDTRWISLFQHLTMMRGEEVLLNVPDAFLGDNDTAYLSLSIPENIVASICKRFDYEYERVEIPEDERYLCDDGEETKTE